MGCPLLCLQTSQTVSTTIANLTNCKYHKHSNSIVSFVSLIIEWTLQNLQYCVIQLIIQESSYRKTEHANTVHD